MTLLIVYASKHGSTGEIAQFMGETLRALGLNVVVKPVQEVQSIDEYSAVVMGSPVYTGSWLPEMTAFVREYTEQLTTKPVYTWVACIRVLEEFGRDHVLEFYLPLSLLNKLNLRGIGVFAGRLKQDEIDWNERWTLGARYDGQTWPTNFDGDFRDWDKIRTWIQKVAAELT